jgi:hypothetical protein
LTFDLRRQLRQLGTLLGQLGILLSQLGTLLSLLSVPLGQLGVPLGQLGVPLSNCGLEDLLPRLLRLCHVLAAAAKFSPPPITTGLDHDRIRLSIPLFSHEI